MEHSCSNIHRRQLLKEQLRGVRKMDLRDLSLVVARPALKLVLLEVSTDRYPISKGKLYGGGRKTYATGVIRPQISQMCTLNASDTSNNLAIALVRNDRLR